MKKWERPRKIKVRKITTIILIHHYYLSSFPDDERKRELERGSQRRKAAQARKLLIQMRIPCCRIDEAVGIKGSQLKSKARKGRRGLTRLSYLSGNGNRRER